MTLLAVLRHAETPWSSEGRIQGQVDVPLSEQGRAALRGRTLPEPCRDMRVVTSPLARCVETAALLGARAAAIEPRIVEMHWGDWQGRRLAALRAGLGEAMHANESRGLDFTPHGGESPRQVLARVRPWLAELAAQGRPTCAVTHRGVIRVIVAAAFGWDMRGRPPVKLDWGAVHLFRLDGQGAPRAWRTNIALGGAQTEATR
jgi:broad specificity phosphatase PhoE